MRKVKVSVVEVTPEDVDERLKTIRSNRAATNKHINAFVWLINEKRFRDYGVIYADANDRWFDGQNRLHAQKKTGHTAKYVVISGFDQIDMNMMVDSGKKRTNGQRLKGLKYEYANLAVSAIEECLDLSLHWKRSVDMVFADHIVSYLEANPQILEYIKFWNNNRLADLPLRTLVAMQHLLAGINEKKCDEFMLKLSRRDNLKPGEPLYAFFKMLTTEPVVNEDSPAKKNRWKRNGLIEAWNAFYADKSIDEMTPTTRVVDLHGLKTKPLDLSISGDDDDEVEDEFDENEGEAAA
jgi:hypothetical protein